VLGLHAFNNNVLSGSVEETQLVYVDQLLGFTVMCYPLALDICAYLFEYPLP